VLSAITSTLSILGSSNSSPTFCCNAEATCPERWGFASRLVRKRVEDPER
jgi:hypothetical protein